MGVGGRNDNLSRPWVRVCKPAQVRGIWKELNELRFLQISASTSVQKCNTQKITIGELQSEERDILVAEEWKSER